MQEKHERDTRREPGFRAFVHVKTMIAGFARDRLFVLFSSAT
jgi:hypothetical protein